MLTAALSSINADLYLTTRMLFSLARGGHAPAHGLAWRYLASAAGLAFMVAILVTTWWVPGFRVTLLCGIPWLAFLTVTWRLSRRPDPS